MLQEKTVDVIIPAYKPGEDFLNLLWMLQKQTVKPGKIIVIVTENAEAVYPDFSAFENVTVLTVQETEFDHGNTRNRGAAEASADQLLFMTQDAEPVDTHLIEHLLEAFREPGVAVSYARQLPKKDCRIIERYTRRFNYPETSRIKSAEDLKTLGIKTYFCSNVCAMYDRAVFEKLGGFTKKTIFNEDMIFAHQAITNGYKIAYAADAEVLHSHNLSGMQQYRRNFDLAVSQADHPEVFEGLSSEKEGVSLILNTTGYLLKTFRIWWIPYLYYQSIMKYLGYRRGKNYRKMSKKAILRCTMNRYYWEEENGTDQSDKM